MKKVKEKVPVQSQHSSGKNGNSFNKELLERAFRLMYLARQIDNKAMNLLKQGKTFFHIAGAGHEGIQAAVGLQLDPKNDWLFPYYRDLALVLSAGVSTYDFFLQCLGKAEDPASGGRQLPCHWGTTRRINLPTQSSPTGTQFLQAVGVALSFKKEKKNNFVYVSSGEGTTSQGEFHEAVNWASREKLPVMFVIQNNQFAISVHVSSQSGGEDHSIAEMMRGYANLKIMRIDGTNFFTSFHAVAEAMDYMKSGKGPVLIEADVVRLHSHSSSDDQKKYRSKDELEQDKEKCPIEFLKKYLIENKFFTAEELSNIEKEILAEINTQSEKAAEQPNPDPKLAANFVFDESGLKDSFDYESSQPSGNNIVMVDAVNHAMHEEMSVNEKMFIFGEDIADGKGGVFTATKGLSSKYGNDRVFNSPLAEASILGVATGMALAGLRPVVEIQFGDYIWPAFMQMKDELATIRYRSNNAWFAPVVVRTAVGGYIHGGLYHSQNVEAIFAHVPGIYILFPSNAADAKGLLKTAMRLNDPVLFCEHKGLYRQSFAITPEPDENYLVPIGKGKIVKEGNDVTVISYGASLWDSVLVAKKLEEEGHSVEVIDLRSIIPLDEELIYNSVKKTNKAIVIHEDTLTAGFGAEIAARISDNCFQFLDGPVKRLAAKDSHVPYSPILESAMLPSREQIYDEIKNLLMF